MAILMHVSNPLKKNRLSGMVLDFVSLVPAGDNPLAQVVISKAAPATTYTQEDDMGDAISKDDLAPEVVAYIDGLEAEVTDLTKSLEDSEAEVTDLSKSLKDAEDNGLIVKSEEEITKALLAKADPAVRHLIEKQQADLAVIRKAAEDERNTRLEREFISKAEALPMVSEDRTALAGLMRRMSDALSPEDNAAVEKMLTTANTLITKGNLFSEFGSGGSQSTVSKSVESAAAEIRKAEPTLTEEQAIAKAYETNPALLAADMTQEG